MRLAFVITVNTIRGQSLSIASLHLENSFFQSGNCTLLDPDLSQHTICTFMHPTELTRMEILCIRQHYDKIKAFYFPFVIKYIYLYLGNGNWYHHMLHEVTVNFKRINSFVCKTKSAGAASRLFPFAITVVLAIFVLFLNSLFLVMILKFHCNYILEVLHVCWCSGIGRLSTVANLLLTYFKSKSTDECRREGNRKISFTFYFFFSGNLLKNLVMK